MQDLLRNSNSVELRPLEDRVPRRISKKFRQNYYQLNNYRRESRFSLQSRSMSNLHCVGHQAPTRKKEGKENTRADQAVQTEVTKDVNNLYKNGVIMYPSSKAFTSKKKDHIESLRKIKPAQQGSLEESDTDSVIVVRPTSDKIFTQVENVAASKDSEAEVNTINEKDYIQRNIRALEGKTHKKNEIRDPTRPPPGYQKGVVPKYLRQRSDANVTEIADELDCPQGHVLLPEVERKETLKVLRQSYADRVQELNSMPIRNETIRMRRRKLELENELKKIDEGIKVFQRPKVFVKVD